MSRKLPLHLFLKIFRLAGISGFESLAVLAAASRKFKSLAYRDVVLKDANLGAFISHGEHVLTDSPYRPFFVRCLLANNQTACLLEGLRVAFCHGEIDIGTNILENCTEPDTYGIFCLGMLQICGGEWVLGSNTLARMGWRKDIPAAIIIAETIRETIVAMKPINRGRFRFVMEIPCPTCDCEGEDHGLCPECFVPWHAIRLCILS